MKINLLRIIMWGALLACAFSSIARPGLAKGLSVDEVARLDGVDSVAGSHGDNFGTVMAIAGDTAVVGTIAPSEDLARVAIVFQRIAGAWTEAQLLTPPMPSSIGAFGTSVAITGDTVFVGAPTDSGGRGAVWVFRHDGSTYVQSQKLALVGGGPGDRFGIRIAAQDDTLLVVSRVSNGAGVGSVHVFSRSGDRWGLGQTLDAKGANTGQVAIDGDLALVGAPSEETVWVFERQMDAWAPLGPLVSPDPPAPPMANESFGAAVALDGDTVAIGAPKRVIDDGGVYVFTRTSGTLVFEQLLEVDDMGSSPNLGAAVALLGSTLVAGAPNPSTATGPGRARVWTRSGGSWRPQETLDDCSPLNFGKFGQALVVAGDQALVGAPDQVGRVCTFTRTVSTYRPEQILRGRPNVDGNHMGTASAISGRYAMVGAPFADGDPFTRVGTVYAFERQGGVWHRFQEISFPESQFSGNFGETIAMSGDQAVIGRPGRHCESSALVYRLIDSVWTLIQEVDAGGCPNFYDGPSFGKDVWLDETRMVIGAPDIFSPYPGVGGAYPYLWDGEKWQQIPGFVPSGVAAGAAFGFSVAVDGDVALVTSLGFGAKPPNLPGENGAVHAYGFVGDDWVLEQVFTPDDVISSDGFGVDVALFGDTAAVAAVDRFYVLRKVDGMWTEHQRIDLATFNIHFHGARLMVGDPAADKGRGEVLIFDPDKVGVWQETERFQPAGLDAGAAFGFGMSSDGPRLIVGAISAQAPPGQVGRGGAAFVFAVDVVLTDDFETGGTSAWSLVIGEKP